MASTTIQKTTPTFETVTYSQTKSMASGVDVQYVLGGSKPGWTPINCFFRHSYSTQVFAGAEVYTMANGSFQLVGFGRYTGTGTVSVTFYADIIWIKN